MRVMNEEILERLTLYIKQFARDNNGESPSLHDIVEHTKMAKATAYRYILELERRGAVSYSGKKTLVSEQQKKMKCGFKRIPIVGQIVCGTPDDQEEHISGYLAIPEEWIDGECFLLKAYGDSMIDIGIYKDDLILVKKTETASSGQVVVALTENGNTLKRLFWEGGIPRLHAENQLYRGAKRDFYPKELTIQGVALKVIRDIQ